MTSGSVTTTSAPSASRRAAVTPGAETVLITRIVREFRSDAVEQGQHPDSLLCGRSVSRGEAELGRVGRLVRVVDAR